MDDVTALFNQYENEYCNKSTDISRKITTASTLGAEAKRKKLVEVDVDIKEADTIIKKMDNEARSVAPDRQKQLQNKVKEYKADLASLKEQLQKARSTTSDFEAGRAELGLGMDYASSSAAQRDRMLSATAKLEQSDERLKQGKALLAETEAIGASVLGQLQAQRETIQRSRDTLAGVNNGDLRKAEATLKTMNKRELGTGILANLHSQRETIVRSRDTLHGADDNITKARKILSSMSKRMLQNKLIMFGIIGTLLAAIILIIYFKAK
ncbi:hypothetical protein HYH02_010717 [Chlamydomonas schloesseri]|uniref:t-SNARE coiled-coil homology domain-containing protein n=1 Tax=Chlamydomonas schloesseri TaxID=2026947 RepID=A0A835T531_9CHLO|nr:hypothetical protein HYH02_010717 [Chlamydomonas schloesseri]|eukprot:KAG2438923.1 hypothetical protein HYH02_010717 [Chlamydomonas schloesseri]